MAQLIRRALDQQPDCIAVVDDMATSRAIVGHLLREHFHCEVASFPDGESALRWLNNHRCALVVADYRMPQMNGLDFAERVRKLQQKLPIVILTVHEISDIEERAKKLGVTMCMSKQSGNKELLRQAATLLGKTPDDH